jgi:hypothetical protein
MTRRIDDKIADTAPLNLGSALDRRKNIGRNTRFDTRGSTGWLWHDWPPISSYNVRHIDGQVN